MHKLTPDFRSVLSSTGEYKLTATQAQVVATLYDFRLQGVSEIHQDLLLQAAGSETKRLTHLFRSSPAWGSLIRKSETPGYYSVTENCTLLYTSTAAADVGE